jgi:REP-associated tyrosine transposase
MGLIMKKFKDRYRIPSARLQSWDYGQNGGYFITICTKNIESSFGDVVDGKMQLSQTGQLAERFCKEIPHHFPYIKLGRYVVMPNHLHIIIIICKSGDHGRDAINRVSTHPGL